VILSTVMWYQNQDKALQVLIEEIRTGQESELVQSRACFALQENEYREKKWRSSNTNYLSLYTLCLPPSNHSSCSDVPCEYPNVILHTINTALIHTTTAQHLTSRHLKPLPYHNTLYRHHLLSFSHHLCVHPRLRLSITLSPSIHQILFVGTLQSIPGNPSRDKFDHSLLWFHCSSLLLHYICQNDILKEGCAYINIIIDVILFIVGFPMICYIVL